ncbi:Protein transport protein Sec24-like [Camellia lanceoleosa]|uniref:Protein transport protein Sec24-like n=1 Tax=Camellia lanceoleosa TaxID=1840588 RepID=A0ACC0G7Y5_9ERIC|nr:Protein transport protein Sec24-like [Camellia lanceoleosa]
MSPTTATSSRRPPLPPPPPPPPSPPSTFISRAKAQTQSLMAMRRPWKELFDFSFFSRPYSYAGLFLLCSVWLYFYFLRDHPIMLFNRIIDDRVVLVVLSLVTVIALVFTNIVFELLCCVNFQYFSSCISYLQASSMADEFNISRLPVMADSLDSRGLYVYDDGFRFVIWFGKMLSPDIAMNLLREDFATDFSKNLSSSDLTGEIAPALFGLKSLKYLDLSYKTSKKSFLETNANGGDEAGTEEEQAAFMKELETFHKERCLEFKPPRFYGAIKLPQVKAIT